VVARRLKQRGHYVVYGELAGDDPDLSSLRKAIGVVANGEDHDNAVLTLSARNQGFEGKIVSMVENPARRNPMLRAGADAVFTPIHVLAAAIADKASVRISPRVSGVRSLGRHLCIAELRIDEGSSLAGETLATAGVRANTGATIIGEWLGGDLVPLPGSLRKRREHRKAGQADQAGGPLWTDHRGRLRETRAKSARASHRRR